MDRGPRLAWSVALALALAALGIVARDAPIRPRAVAGSAVLALALIWAAALGPVDSPWVPSLTFGAVAAQLYWIGRAVRLAPRPNRPGPAPTPPRGFRIARGLILPILALTLPTPLGATEGNDSTPIVALFPSDGVPSPTDRPSRVLLRLADFERLQAWADAGRDTPPVTVIATDALHRVHPSGREASLVESRFVLVADGPGPRDWSLPIVEARDLSAQLDGREVPLAIGPEAREATVSLPGPGRFVLEVRRVVPRQAPAGAPRIDLPIPPLATALVEVDPTPDLEPAEVAAARGTLTPQDGSTRGRIGPLDRLVVRWSDRDAPEAPSVVKAIEGALLWDVREAGDRVLVRLTPHDPAGLATLRLAADPGTSLRPLNTPGLVELLDRGPAGFPEWVARFDPPLADGAPLLLEVWRPVSGPGPRTLPRLTPKRVTAYSGILGLRRTPAWSGRLETPNGTAPLTDPAFVAAWGELPRDPLTFAGAARFTQTPTIEVGVAPPTPRLTIGQAIRLLVSPGRVAVLAEFTLKSAGGRPREADARIPEALILERVEGDGLTHWSRPEPTRLRLRFDGSVPPPTTLRLFGRLDVANDPMRPDPSPRSVALPWPVWVDAAAGPSSLTIESETPCRLDDPLGLSAVAAPSPSAPKVYRVDGKHPVSGVLKWTPAPPRVDLEVYSLLCLHPDSAEWVATVRGRVAGGPVSALRLRLPSAWTDSAQVRSDAGPVRVDAATGGDASVNWTVRFGSPSWSSLDLEIRVVRPLPPDGTLSVPELVPLGANSVETLVGLVDASGRGVTSVASTGLRAVSPSRFDPGGRHSRRGLSPQEVYLVEREGGTLQVRVGEAMGPDGEAVRVEEADLTGVLRADGGLDGEAAYRLAPRPGPFLFLTPPARASARGATVDGEAVVPLRRPDGLWAIPLGASARRVGLVWQSPAPPTGGVHVAAVPEPTGPRPPTRLALYAPAATRLDPGPGGWRAVPGDVLGLDRLEGLGRRILSGIKDFDHQAAEARDELARDLGAFDQEARGVERALAWAQPDRASATQAVHRRVAGRLIEARAEVAEGARVAGLADLVNEARGRPGGGLTAAGAGAGRSPIRRIGLGHFFLRDAESPTPAVGPRWSEGPALETWRRGESWALVGTGLVLVVVASALGRMRAGPVRLLAASGVLAVLLTAIGIAPAALLALLAFAGLGLASGPGGQQRTQAG